MPSSAREAAIAFLLGRINYERTTAIPYRSRGFRLQPMRRLLACLGDPQREIPAVHVAGTKGKGSTATMLSQMLVAAGYCTGLYTSPHLDRLEERFAIDGRPCSSDDLVSILDEVRPAVERLDHAASQRGGRGPTFFEVTTALAFLYFVRRGVQIAVLETGLGGRLDSTNVCVPLVTAITSISRDHTLELGNTLAEIAGEKAGIIKPGIPVISGVTGAEAAAVVRQQAAERGSLLIEAGSDFVADYLGLAPTDSAVGQLPTLGAALRFRQWHPGPARELDGLTTRMPGRHQAENAAVAIAVAAQLEVAGKPIGDTAIRRGLAQAQCRARGELVSTSPRVIIDAAHNLASVAALTQLLDEVFPARPRILVFGTSRDKDAADMLSHLLPRFETVVLTRYTGNPRFLDVSTLAAVADEVIRRTPGVAPRLFTAANPNEAWKQVRELLVADPLLCVTGSFFLAAELRQLAVADAGLPTLAPA